MRSRKVWMGAAILSLVASATLGAEPRIVFGTRSATELESVSDPGPFGGLPGITAVGGDTVDPLPQDAQALMSVFDAEAAAIREQAEQKIQSRRETLVKALQALQDSYTREAKLDEAVAIRDRIRQLKVSHLKSLPNPGNLARYVNCIGQSFHFDVVGRTGYSIWGSEVYTYDSDLATAAVHAGVLKTGQRGIVKVTMVKSPESHRGSVQNGVTSYNWGTYSASYTVEPARITDPSEREPKRDDR